MPPRGRKSVTEAAAPAEVYDYVEGAQADPAAVAGEALVALALTAVALADPAVSTPHDIAERAAAARRLDKMRTSRDAALEDREKLQEFVAELQAKLEEARNDATQARKTGGKLFEENGSLKHQLKEVEILHTNAIKEERNRTLFYRTRKETLERAWANGEPFSHHVRNGSTMSSTSVRQPATASAAASQRTTPATPSRAPPASASRPTSAHVRRDGDCPCGAGAVIMMTSHTAANYDRQFYKCPNWDKGGCRYFAWADSWEAPATVRRQPNPPPAPARSAHDDQFFSDDELYGAFPV